MTKKRLTGYILAVTLLCMLAFVYLWLPSARCHQLKGVVLLSIQRSITLTLPEEKSLTIATDSMLQTGFFVSPDGKIQTLPFAMPQTDTLTIKEWLVTEEQRLTKRKISLTHQIKEIEYYEQTHSVRDEGYIQVMDLAEKVKEALAKTDSLEHLVQLAMACNFAKPVTTFRITVRVRNNNDSVYQLPCKVINDSLGLCQTDSLPDDVKIHFFNTTCLRLWSPSLHSIAYPVHWTQSPDSLRPAWVNRTDSLPALAFGAPVLNSWGNVRGMVTKQGIQPIGGWRIAPRMWWNSLRQWVCELFTSHNKVEATPCTTIHRGDTLEIHTGKEVLFRTPSWTYTGHMEDGKRQGEGVYTDTTGGCYQGLWMADTLLRGLLSREDIHYEGSFDALMRPCGIGKEWSNTEYYEGAWSEGMRHGFGISLSGSHDVRAGQWKKDRFMGEHMLYNADRIYGIDISRYQHEIKKKHYNINWNNLHITQLGSNNNMNISGTTDYPVSFCYIKATEGVKIKNKYYNDDARNARKKSIAVGAYHFFSPASGAAQATFFLKNAAPKKGDLPPVLDVELTDAKIKAMGGAAKMRHEMLVWLRTVTRQTGVKPILYVSLNFFTQYLKEGEPELLTYPVWVARYSEYKPYVHLKFWQLSCDGRVQGITGHVDINVFNGTKEQFQSFRKEQCIK